MLTIDIIRNNAQLVLVIFHNILEFKYFLIAYIYSIYII